MNQLANVYMPASNENEDQEEENEKEIDTNDE